MAGPGADRVGLTHLQRGNGRGALTLFGRGAARVQSYGEPYDSVGRAASGLSPDSDPEQAIELILSELPGESHSCVPAGVVSFLPWSASVLTSLAVST